MGVHSFVPLAAAFVYAGLFVVITFNRSWQQQHRHFAWYLVAAITWTLSDSFLRSDLLLEHKLLLFRIVTAASMWWVVQLYVFNRSFLRLLPGPGVLFGYAALLTYGSLAFLGYIPPGVTFDKGLVSPTYGWWLVLYMGPIFAMALMGMCSLVNRLRISVDPKERNRIAYFVVAILLLVGFGFSGVTPLARTFPVSHLGGLLSACVLTYAIAVHELVSVKSVLRRSLAWAGLIVTGVATYLSLFLLMHLLLGFEIKPATLVSTTLAAIAMSGLILLLRNIFVRAVDRLFYRETYGHRQQLFEFVRHGISGVFSLRELSEKLLPPLVKVLSCQQAYMLLPKGGGDFVAEYAEPKTLTDGLPFRIRHDGPVAHWLGRENKCLSRESLDILPEFSGMWQEERDMLRTLGIELMFPLLSRGNLIGILAISRKHSGKYSFEDTNLVEDLASQVAVNLEKEYLQDELRNREQELSLINRLAAVMTSSLNIQDVYDTFVAGLREVIDVDFATVALVEGRQVSISALYNTVGSDWQVGEKIKLKGSATEWVAKNRKSLLEPDLAQDRMFSTGEEYLRHGIRSVVYLPLIAKDEGIGSMVIASRHPNAYTLEQIHLLERLASQISTSVVNARLYASAQQRARVDELTGLFNRRHFDESLKQEVNRHSRYGSMFSLVYLDLDGFKAYNDSFGHLAGDKILTQTGRLIKSTIRSVDLAFRYGGDEFAVILPHSTADDAVAAAERLRNQINGEMKISQAGITASLGLATWPGDGLTTDDIVNAADKALYYAKRTGGNRVCTVSQMLPSMAESLDSAMAAEKETLNTIYALAATIEARDPYTYGHSRKVRGYAVTLAEALGLPSEKVATISHAALLHDIGKIGILDEILNKAGKLDIKETELIRSHPQLSRTIVGHVPSLAPCLPAILHHHERWDGTGYPARLNGEAIPIEARILAIADSFDAMTSRRPYRAPLTYSEAVEELKRCAGNQFDPRLVKAFLPIALATTPEELAAVYDAKGRRIP